MVNGRQRYFKTMRLKNTTDIKNKIVDIISNDQQIKRFCTYITKTPLFNVGETYDGKFIEQPDIKTSIKKKNVIPFMFSDELGNEMVVYVFVSLYDCVFNKNKGVDTNIFTIHVLCPVTHNELEPYGQERIMEISYRIIDLLDGRTFEDTGVGGITFDGTTLSIRRLKTGSDYVTSTLVCSINTSNDRTDIDD